MSGEISGHSAERNDQKKMRETGSEKSERHSTPSFQFYCDLPITFSNLDIQSVSDNRRVVGFDSLKQQSLIFHDGKQISEDAEILCATDSNYYLIATGKGVQRIILKLPESLVRPQSSPVFSVNIQGINENGVSFGSRERDGRRDARTWDPRGVERLHPSADDGEILVCEPFNESWFGGKTGAAAVIWNNSQAVVLEAPNGAIASVTAINGHGMTAGYIVQNELQRAAIWENTGRLIFHAEQHNSPSCAIAMLVDSTYIIEAIRPDESREYWIGKGDKVAPLDASSLLSMQGMRLISIDGVSPSGVMVVTVSPVEGGPRARALVGPEAQRPNLSRKSAS